jgi:hypothetical protein
MYIKSLTNTRLQIKQLKLNNYTKTYTKIIIMATTLIDTRKSIMAQIHESWNEFRTTEGAYELMFGGRQYYENTQRIPFAEEFKKSDTPWSSKQSVLEKNTVHANKLIRLYIALNIDVAYRVPIWQFFEIQSGVVGRIKDEIKLLKRVQKVLKLGQELEVHEPLPNATTLFTHTGNLSLDEIEKDFKVKVKEAKAAAKAAAKAEAKAAKKLAAAQAKAAKAKAKENRKFVLAVAKQIEKNAIAAEKLGNKLAKKTIALLKWAETNDFELEDIVNILESEVESARSDNTMETIIDISA